MTIKHKKMDKHVNKLAARRPVRARNKKCIALPREEISENEIAAAF